MFSLSSFDVLNTAFFGLKLSRTKKNALYSCSVLSSNICDRTQERAIFYFFPFSYNARESDLLFFSVLTERKTED